MMLKPVALSLESKACYVNMSVIYTYSIQAIAPGLVIILPEKKVIHGENGLCEPEQNSTKIKIFILSLCS